MEVEEQKREKARRNVFYLGIVSFLNDVSSEIIFSILPFYLKSFGASYLGIGLAGGIIDGLGNVIKVISGYVSDKIGKRKIIVFLGYLLSSFSKLFLSLSNSVTEVEGFLTLDRVGKGIRTSPRDALLAESGMKSGKAFGFHRMMDTLGAVLGALLALFLIHSGFEYGRAIFLAAIIGFLSVFPLLMVRETAQPVKKPKLTFRLKKFTAFSFFVGLANVSYMFFLLKAQSAGIETAVGLYLLFNVVYALFSLPFGIVSDRIGKTTSLSVGYLFLFAASLFMFFGTSLPHFILGFVFYGLFMAVVEAQQRAFASDLSTSKGFGVGTYHFVFGVSTIVGNLIAGAIAEISLDLVFAYSAVLSIAISLCYLLVKF